MIPSASIGIRDGEGWMANLAIVYRKYFGIKWCVFLRASLVFVLILAIFDVNGYIEVNFMLSFTIAYSVGFLNAIDSFFRWVNFYKKISLSKREEMKLRRDNIYKYPLYLAVSVCFLIFFYISDGFILFSSAVIWIIGNGCSIFWDYLDRRDFDL